MASRRFRRYLVAFSLVAAASGAAGVALWAKFGRQTALPTETGVARAQKPPDDLSLPEADRRYLWALEHHGNVLKKYGLDRLANALQMEDAAGIEHLLAPDFDGRVPESPQETSLLSDVLSAVRRQQSGSPGERLDRTAFVEWLLEQRRLYASPPGAKFAIKTLSPLVESNLDGLWEGTFQLRLWGEAQPGHPGESLLVLRARTERPTEERLQENGWLIACHVEQVSFARSSRFLLREVAAERGIDPERFHDNWSDEPKLGQTGGIYACDYNRDGCIDLLVTDHKAPGLAFFRGTPDGGFEEVTREIGLLTGGGRPAAGISGTADNCAFADLDNDGWEDLIVFSGGLYKNLSGERFVSVGERSNLFWLIYGPQAPKQLPTAILPADYDRDGLVDLYVVRAGHLRDANSSWIEEDPSLEAGNQLLRNLGQGQFEDVTLLSRTRAGGRSVFTAVWLDANDDNWPDLYVISEFGKGLLLVNKTDGTFVERHLVEGLADFGSMGLTCGDFDNDGRIDIYSANMYSKAGTRVIGNIPEGRYSDDVMAKLRRLVSGSRLYRNLGGLRFEEVGHDYQVYDVGWAWGAALADLNNDGWQDLYATAGYMSRDRTKPDG